MSRSQAPFYLCALCLISNQAEEPLHSSVTLFGGDRPSQTAQLTLSVRPDSRESKLESQSISGWYFTDGSPSTSVPGFKASHLSYTKYARGQYQPAVKVHGVFPSCCGYVASSPPLQFHRVGGGDSAPVVTPFMQVGTYPTRNFATLGPS
jgi:hypothetical protein